MARSLELANLRIQQLQAENDQLKESHGIVVETKESVINTLSKRVTELSNEVRRNSEINLLELLLIIAFVCTERLVQESHGRSDRDR